MVINNKKQGKKVGCKADIYSLYSGVPTLSVISTPSSKKVAKPKSMIFTRLKSLFFSSKMLSGYWDDQNVNEKRCGYEQLSNIEHGVLPPSRAILLTTHLHISVNDFLAMAIV